MLWDLHFYFKRAKPKPKGGPIYMNISALLDLTHDHLIKENHWWLSQKQMNLWECTIQANKTAQCGWALYSTNQIDQEALVADISKWISHPVAAR